MERSTQGPGGGTLGTHRPPLQSSYKDCGQQSRIGEARRAARALSSDPSVEASRESCLGAEGAALVAVLGSAF